LLASRLHGQVVVRAGPLKKLLRMTASAHISPDIL
jgi:hypothetical protein